MPRITQARATKPPKPPRVPRETLEAKLEQIQQSRSSPAEYELYRLDKTALLDIAKQAGIIGYRNMRKDQLIASIVSIPQSQREGVIKKIEDEIEKKEQKEIQRDESKKPNVPRDDLDELKKTRLNTLGRSLGLTKGETTSMNINELRARIRELRSKPQSESEAPTEPRRRRRAETTSESEAPSQPRNRNTSLSVPSDLEYPVPFYDRNPMTPIVPTPEEKEKPSEEKKDPPVDPRIAEIEKERRQTDLRRQIRERGDVDPDSVNWGDWSQQSSGEGKHVSGKGISNFDIDKMLAPFPEYLGCVSSDELLTKILPQIKPQSRAFWINNLDSSKEKGSHWVGFFVDARPEGSNSIEYSDSFGEPIPDNMRKDIQEIADKLNAQKYLKLKENTLVQRQDDKTPNCGFFAVKFVLDRMRGKSFAESTGFDSSMKDESVDGEKDISKFKKIMGWGFIPSFMRRDNSMVDQIKNFVFFPAKELSVPFKKFMAKYGDYAIVNAKIRRQPISWAIDKLLNVISLGTWSQGKKELNYPDLFHLGIMLELRKGGDTKNVVLEKLERPHFTESWKDDSNVEYLPVTLKQSSGKRAFPSLNEFIQKTIDKIGIHNFSQYAGFRGDKNCQNFIMDLLNANSSLTPQAKAFIYQPIEELVKKMPSWVDKVSQSVTDFSARARQFFGIGKRASSLTRPNPKLDALLKIFQK